MSAVAIWLGALAAAAAAGWLAVAELRRWLDVRLRATDAEVRRLADASSAGDRGADEVRREMEAVRLSLERIQVREDERREREQQAWEALHRVAAVLSGTQSTGRAGENVLGEALAHLPPSMLERDFRVNGRVVEFGLVLPDGRRLPVDSKWPAEREVVALADSTDPVERDRAVRAIERVVAARAREVAAYLDPAVTAPVAVAAVPDAAYAVLRRAHVDAYRQGVIVIPYSMALPVVLFLHQTVSRLGDVADVQACLADLGAILDAVESTLENRLERASTMLANGAGELRSQVGRARTTLARARSPAIEGAGLEGTEHERAVDALGRGPDVGTPRLVGLTP